MVGPDVGDVVGPNVGREVTGDSVGIGVGPRVGDGVGSRVGPEVGDVVGGNDGRDVVGESVGGSAHDVTVPHGEIPLHVIRTVPLASSSATTRMAVGTLTVGISTRSLTGAVSSFPLHSISIGA